MFADEPNWEDSQTGAGSRRAAYYYMMKLRLYLYQRDAGISSTTPPAQSHGHNRGPSSFFRMWRPKGTPAASVVAAPSRAKPLSAGASFVRIAFLDWRTLPVPCMARPSLLTSLAATRMFMRHALSSRLAGCLARLARGHWLQTVVSG